MKRQQNCSWIENYLTGWLLAESVIRELVISQPGDLPPCHNGIACQAAVRHRVTVSDKLAVPQLPCPQSSALSSF